MKLREIERLRAVAILMVLVVHCGSVQPYLPAIATSSWSGVDLFFVISGYVVTLSLVRMLPPLEAEASFIDAFALAKDTLRAFYARRFFRILPAALTVFLVYRVLVAWYPPSFGTSKETTEETFAFLGGLYNYALAFHPKYQMGAFWSLSVEEHFYLFLPILFVAFRTTSARLGAAAGIALFSIIARALPPPDVTSVIYYQKFSSHLRFDSLMAGVALALVAGKASSSPIMPRGLMRFVVLPGCVAIIACIPGVVAEQAMVREGFIALWVFSAIVVGFASLDQGYVLALPVLAPVLEYIGARSYALYLVHNMVFRVDDALSNVWPTYRKLVPTDGDHAWHQPVVQLAMVFVAAEVLHRAVERPFMRLGRTFVDPVRRAAFRVSRRAKVLCAIAATLVLCVLGHHKILLALGRPNLARGCHVTMSSHLDGKPGGEALVNGELEPEYGAHTQAEDFPWMTIDLGKPTDVGSLRVYNRADGHQDQQVPLQVSVSNDGKSFTMLNEHRVAFSQSLPWRMRVYWPPVRYVRFRVNKRATYFCLSEVEIFEGQWMARLP